MQDVPGALVTLVLGIVAESSNTLLNYKAIVTLTTIIFTNYIV